MKNEVAATNYSRLSYCFFIRFGSCQWPLVFVSTEVFDVSHGIGIRGSKKSAIQTQDSWPGYVKKSTCQIARHTKSSYCQPRNLLNVSECLKILVRPAERKTPHFLFWRHISQQKSELFFQLLKRDDRISFWTWPFAIIIIPIFMIWIQCMQSSKT